MRVACGQENLEQLLCIAFAFSGSLLWSGEHYGNLNALEHTTASTLLPLLVADSKNVTVRFPASSRSLSSSVCTGFISTVLPKMVERGEVVDMPIAAIASSNLPAVGSRPSPNPPLAHSPTTHSSAANSHRNKQHPLL